VSSALTTSSRAKWRSRSFRPLRVTGSAFLPWSALRGGALGGVLKNDGGTGRRAGQSILDVVAEHRNQIEQDEAFAEELGHEPADIALAWLLHQPAVTAPGVGPRTMEQFEASLRALDVKLDVESLQRLDKMFPGYKPAPEAYSW
jgi:aryl-alcohol dehydrogenase-like predicted oxidoreductase